jgi:hypothetical protein
MEYPAIPLSDALKNGEVGYNHELEENPPKAVSKEEMSAVTKEWFADAVICNS